jgi:hypothetical protein
LNCEEYEKTTNYTNSNTEKIRNSALIAWALTGFQERPENSNQKEKEVWHNL